VINNLLNVNEPEINEKDVNRIRNSLFRYTSVSLGIAAVGLLMVYDVGFPAVYFGFSIVDS
jgi:hypothetical protein